MADFTSGVNPVQERGPGLTPNPVNTSTANEISSAANILGVVGQSAAQGYGLAQQIKQAQQNASVTDNFAQNLLRISDLEQQGVMKPEQALRRYRLVTAQALADHPLLQDQIFKTYGTIVEKAGLGLNVAEDYKRQQDDANTLHMQSLTDAQKAGWGSPNDPPEVQQQMAEKHQQFLFAQSQMEAANALLDHKVKENQLVTSGLDITRTQLGIQGERANLANQSISIRRNQIGLAQDQAKQQFLAGAKNLSDAYFGKWQQDVANIAQQVKAGQLKPEDAVRQIQQQQAAIHQQTGSLAAGYDSTGSLEALTKPIDMLAQATIDQLNGNVGKTVTENTVANIQGLKSIQLLSSDPNFLTLTATSKMIPAGSGALQQSLGDAAVNLLKRNKVIPLDPSDNPAQFGVSAKPGDITHNDDPDHNKGVDQYFSLVKGAISNIRAGNNDPALDTEVSGNISNILRGVGVYGPTASSPSELNSVVKFIADPQIGSYLRTHPDVIKGDTAAQAIAVKNQEYDRVVLPLVQQEFINSKVQVGETLDQSSPAALRVGGIRRPDERSSTQWIHPQFNGTGVTFIPVDPSKPDVQREAQRLNTEVAPVINNMIRANAHLAGSVDYKASYEDFMNRMIPAGPNYDADGNPVKSSQDITNEETGINQ